MRGLAMPGRADAKVTKENKTGGPVTGQKGVELLAFMQRGWQG